MWCPVDLSGLDTHHDPARLSRNPVCSVLFRASPPSTILSVLKPAFLEVMRLGKRARLADKDEPRGGKQNELWCNRSAYD